MLNNGIILRFFAFGALIIALRLFFADLSDEYSFLPILPFFCFFLYLFCDRFIGNKKIDVATLMILCLTFVRYCFLSLILFYGNFFAETSWSFTQDYFNDAVLLMIYESFVIFIALILANEICLDKSKHYVVVERKKITNTIIVSLLLFIILIIIIYPDTLNLFNSIFQLNQLDFTQGTRINKADVGAIKRVLQTLFSVFFLVVRVFFPAYVLKWYSQRHNSSLVFVFLTLFFVAIQFFFITSTFAESIVCSLAILLCANRNNPNAGGKLVRISPVFVASVVFVYFYVRYLVSTSSPYKSMYAGSNIFEHVCALFNAYFTGPFNVAGSFMPVDENYWSIVYSTFVGTIPFNSTLFGARGSSLQPVYNMFNHSYGQIPSTIGDGLYFFNPIFSPVFSFALTFFAILLCRKAESTKSYWMYLAYTFASIVFALGIAMYNEHISLYWFNQCVVPLFLLAFVCEKRIYIKDAYEIKN